MPNDMINRESALKDPGITGTQVNSILAEKQRSVGQKSLSDLVFQSTKALLVALTFCVPASQLHAESIGNGRLFNNDYFGDGHDRWRTGSYVFSHLRSQQPYDGSLGGFGEILEYRFRSEIMAHYKNQDRPYVGMLGLGVHTHFGLGDASFSVGGDALAIGPQTGMDEFQKSMHRKLDMRLPYTDNALEDQFAFQGTSEARYNLHLSPSASIRPFVEVKAGAEDVARVGADIIIGSLGQKEVMIRDVVTGQLYRGTHAKESGMNLVLGGDIGSVYDSLYLPEAEGISIEAKQTRLRAGVTWQPFSALSIFYGATYLSPEFDGQEEGQVVGSLTVGLNF